MIKFTVLDRPTKKSKKANKAAWYIYKTEYLMAAMFWKVAGGVGRMILDFILWKRGMNGVEWISLPNEHFLVEHGITRQRKSEAIQKLKKAELIDVDVGIGKATKVKLKFTVKEDTENG